MLQSGLLVVSCQLLNAPYRRVGVGDRRGVMKRSMSALILACLVVHSGVASGAQPAEKAVSVGAAIETTLATAGADPPICLRR